MLIKNKGIIFVYINQTQMENILSKYPDFIGELKKKKFVRAEEYNCYVLLKDNKRAMMCVYDNLSLYARFRGYNELMEFDDVESLSNMVKHILKEERKSFC